MGFRKAPLEESSKLYHRDRILLAGYLHLKFRNLQDPNALGGADKNAALSYCFPHNIDILFL
jgi:hypothetical protein